MKNLNFKIIIPALFLVIPGFIFWIFLGWYSITSTIIVLFGDRTEARIESIYVDKGVYWGNIRYQVEIDGGSRFCVSKIPIGPESMQLKEGQNIEIALKYNSCDRALSPMANRFPFVYLLIFIVLVVCISHVGNYILRYDSETVDKH